MSSRNQTRIATQARYQTARPAPGPRLEPAPGFNPRAKGTSDGPAVRALMISTGILRPAGSVEVRDDGPRLWTEFFNLADEPVLRIRPLSLAEQEASDRTVYRFPEHKKGKQLT